MNSSFQETVLEYATCAEICSAKERRHAAISRPKVRSSPLAQLPWKVHIHESMQRYWAGAPILRLLDQLPQLEEARNFSDANVVVGLDDIKFTAKQKKMYIRFQTKDEKNRGTCHAVNVNSWSTTDNMDEKFGVPWVLHPLIHKYNHSGRLIVSKDQTTPLQKKKYLASFKGTHYKDIPEGDRGMIRNVLRLLHRPQDGFIVYTRCHTSHPQECADDDEKGALQFSKSTTL